jgi:tryptophanyl-tRNA synthetase
MVAEAVHVPVGADQVAHLEVTRVLARRFNRDYGNGESILVEPDIAIVEGIKIAALRGGGKMSKSDPSNALLLTDTPDVVARKIRRAETTTEPGAMPDILASHFMVAERLSQTDDQRAAVAAVKTEHLAGKAVMGTFKRLLTDITVEYLGEFQERFNSLGDAEIKRILLQGGEQASAKAEGVLDRVYSALGLMSSKFLYE